MNDSKITHYLKTWPDVFEETWKGLRLHQYRKNDRDYKVGDLIVLEEFEPVGEHYLGRQIICEITSISYGPEWNIPEGYAVFTISINDLYTYKHVNISHANK